MAVINVLLVQVRSLCCWKLKVVM